MRERSHYGEGDESAPYCDGDLVRIPADSPARTSGLVPASVEDLYTVVMCRSCGGDGEWKLRVQPLDKHGRPDWLATSKAVFILPERDDTAGWSLVESAEHQA